MQPPSTDHFPNPNRPSNPFTPSPEPDWVEVKRVGNGNGRRPEPPPTRGTTRAQTLDFNSPSASNTSLLQGNGTRQTTRKLVAPPFLNGPSPVPHLDGTRDLKADTKANTQANSELNRTISNASSTSTHSLPNLPRREMAPPPNFSNLRDISSRKPAPPIPSKKPSLLSTKLNPAGTASPPPPQRYRDDHEEERRRDPQPPPPRRSMAPPPRREPPSLMDDEKPPLPPRTGTGLSADSQGRRQPNLLDDEPEDMEALRGWEVLRPVR
jgi:hypothetical protein